MSWLVFRTCFAPVYDFRRKAESISSGMLDTEQTMHVFKSKLKSLNGETGMSYLDRDTFGMYKSRDVNNPATR